MSVLHQELRALGTAAVFFTQIPLPCPSNLSKDDLRRSSTYFSLVGSLVGAVAAGVWWSAAQIFPVAVAAGLSIAASVLLTGAMHEDGFADVCDGFGGGGPDRARILAIMKDSHVGAFGVIGLILMLALRWQAISALPAATGALLLVAAHTVSRALSISLMATLDYAREGESKSRAVTSKLKSWRLVAVLVSGLFPLAFLPAGILWTLLPLLAVRLLLARWFKQRIGGYTGDCLGAAQQVSELVFLLCAEALS